MSRKKQKTRFERHMIRPLIYQVFTRFVVCLCFSLLWARLVSPRVAGSSAAWAFQFFAAFFAVMAWMAWLRMDGVRVPSFDRKLFRRRKKPPMAFGDMADYMDEPVVTFEELTDDEKDLTLFFADLITCVLFLAAGFLL